MANFLMVEDSLEHAAAIFNTECRQRLGAFASWSLKTELPSFVNRCSSASFPLLSYFLCNTRLETTTDGVTAYRRGTSAARQ